MTRIQSNPRLIFAHASQAANANEKSRAELEQSNLTADSDIVFTTPEGEVKSLTVDAFLKNAEQINTRGTKHLSVQLPGGRSVVVELANLSRETLERALQNAIQNIDPVHAQELTQSAQSILQRIRQPDSIPTVQRLNPASSHNGPVSSSPVSTGQAASTQDADFVAVSNRQLAELKAGSDWGDNLLDRAGLVENGLRVGLNNLLKANGLVDQQLKIYNLEIKNIQSTRVDFLKALDQARQQGQNSVEFKGQSYTIPQQSNQFLSQQSEALKAVLAQKQALFNAVQSWTEQIPTTFSDAVATPFNFVADVYNSFKSRAGIGDNTAHGSVGSTVVAGEAVKTLNQVGKVMRTANVGSNLLHGIHGLLQTDTARSIASFLVKQGVKDFPPQLVNFINGLAKAGGGTVKAIFAGFDKLLETTASDLIGREGAEKIAQVLAKLGSKMGAEGAEMILKRLSIGNVLAGYSAGYYTSNALGLNYIDENIDGTAYKLRLSEEASWANLAAGILNGTAIATSTPPGQPLNIVATIGAIGAELLAEYMIAKDKEVLTDVHRNILTADSAEALQTGLDTLQRKYGGLDKIQAVLGQTGDGKDLVGVVLRKMMQVGADLPPEMLNQALGDIMKGVDTRYFTDDNAIMGFLMESLSDGTKARFDEALAQLKFDELKDILLADSNFKGILNKLDDSNRLMLLKILNEGFKANSEVAVIEALYSTAQSPELKGKMTGQLLNSYITHSVHRASPKLKEMIWENLTAARAEGPESFKRFLNHVQLEGNNAVPDFIERFSNEKSGQLLAWMIQAGADHQQFTDYVGRLSEKGWEDDNITREFLKELKTLDISVSSLQSVLGQDDIRKLFDNLESMWTSESEYGLIEKISAAADKDSKVYMLKRLMSGATFERAEKAIQEILSTSSPREQKYILSQIDLNQLGWELESGDDAARMMNRLVGLGFPAQELSEKLESFFSGVQAQGLLVNTHDDDTALDFVRGLSDEALQTLSGSLKLRMFKSLDTYWTTGGEYQLLKRLAHHSDATTRAKMIQQLMTWPTLGEAQSAISDIVSKSNDAEKRIIMAHLDLKDLGYTLDNVEQAAEAMNALVKLGLPQDLLNSKLQEFFSGVSEQNYFASLDTGSDNVAHAFISKLDDTALAQIPDDFRLRLFNNLDSGTTWQSEYDMMRKIADGASTDTKAEMIQALMIQDPTTSQQEDVIWYILNDTSYTGGEFLDLINKLDTTQLAREIENDKDAARIAVWISKAYEKAGVQPAGSQLDDFLIELARAHRPAALTHFMEADEIQADSRALFKNISASTIRSMTEKLMDGSTNASEEEAIYKLLKNTSWKQFSELMSSAPYRARLESELSSSQWSTVQDWFWEIPKHL